MSKFADYFVICGLDYNSGLEPDRFSEDNLQFSPLDRPYKNKVLAHFPSNVPDNPFDASAVCMFSLPNGLRFRTQKHSVTQVPTFNSFLITREDGTRCYGFSLVFYEEVRNYDICHAMQTLQAMYLTEISSKGGVKSRTIQNAQNQTPQSRSLPRHFKISTPSLGSALTYYDISKDKLFVSKSIAILCRKAYVQAAKIFLENLYRCVPKRASSTTSISVESYVFNLLYEVELPAPGKSILIHLPASDAKLPFVTTVLQCPDPLIELPHLDFSLRLMFLWLGVETVIQLFTCLLLENQILLRSTDCQKLMVVAEGITSLLFPFNWPHVYVPILPATLHHFLDAPVPFLMGLYASSENIKVGSEATLCYIDIDKCKVQLPEELPAFPHLEAFTAEIWSVLDKYGVHVLNSENTRNAQEMSRSCTLPGKPQNRRKLSIHDTLDCDRPPSPPGSARSEALQRIADIVRRTGVTLDQEDSVQPVDSYSEDLRFNNSIREIFVSRFVHMFHSYENFVMFPNQDKEDWFNNRDSMQNFDKASFLSDQPEQHRLFLWRFLESQMFATLIDNKILSTWGEIDKNLSIFDRRIRLLKQRFGGENMMRSLSYEPCTIGHETQKLLDRRMNYPDFESPPPKEILTSPPSVSKCFPMLNAEVLNKTPVINKGSIPRASALKKDIAFSLRSGNLNTDNSANKTINQNVSPALLAQANWTFVEKLLKDCKMKTKRMLLAKLGAEGVTLSSNNVSDSFGAFEESTLVASLCDFLERVWSHGLQRKRGKSALWSHLVTYQEQHQSVNKFDSKFLSPAEITRMALRLENWSGTNTENASMRMNLPPLPESLLFDIMNSQAMSDVKTSIGMARAWIRLALEKKQLSKHIRTLLSDQNILRNLYKRSAFLRCEEEKEQFLFHLLSLNAVDYFCFTSTYPTTVISYRIVIVPSRKGTTTSANVWIVLSGTLSETKKIPIPKATLNFECRHQNLGVLTTLRIGHDNTGLSAKWMIEYVLVRNEITGHTYNFPCSRWLGRGVDDGSTERLLVGNLIPSSKAEGEETTYTGSLGRTHMRSHSPGPPRNEVKPSQIQHMLGDCVNSIVKWHYRRNSERNTTLTALLCGDFGLVKCLELVFLLGFKSARLFVFTHYLWDYFVRVREQFEAELLAQNSGNHLGSMERNHQETVAVWRCYCHLVDEIQSVSHSLGKDGKFQLFICLSVREHLLHRMLLPMAACKITQEMYEENSFLRNRGLLTFLRQILLPLDELDVILENSLTYGISSPLSH